MSSQKDLIEHPYGTNVLHSSENLCLVEIKSEFELEKFSIKDKPENEKFTTETVQSRKNETYKKK